VFSENFPPSSLPPASTQKKKIGNIYVRHLINKNKEEENFSNFQIIIKTRQQQIRKCEKQEDIKSKNKKNLEKRRK